MFKDRSGCSVVSLKGILRTFRNVTAVTLAAYLFHALWTFSPIKHSHDELNRMITRPLVVTLDRSSPIYAALEDTIEGLAPMNSSENAEDLTGSVQAEMLPQSLEFLSAGVVTAVATAKKIVHDNVREAALLAQSRIEKERTAKQLLEEAARQIEKISGSGVVAKSISQSDRHHKKVISLKELNISREELINGLLLPMAASTQDESPELIGPSSRANGQIRFVANNGVEVQKFNREVNRSTEKESKKAMTTSVESGSGYLIKGALEFEEGLAITNPNQQVVIYREVEGEARENAKVSLRDGRFEIYVEESNGQLVGELISGSGELEGQGQLAVPVVIGLTADGRFNRTSSILKLRPVSQGIAGKTISDATDLKQLRRRVGQVQVKFKGMGTETISNNDGLFQNRNFLSGSTALVEAGKKGYLPTVSLLKTHLNQWISLIHEKALEKLVDLRKKNGIEAESDRAVIYGRVLKSGEPASGATVELLTVNEVMTPVYFNDKLLPDTHLKATTRNGLYAFYPVSAGVHAIRAMNSDGHNTESYILPTEAHKSTAVDLDFSLGKKIQLRSFDAFETSNAVAVQLTSLGRLRQIGIPDSGRGGARFSAGQKLMFYDVNSESSNSYERIRVLIDGEKGSEFLPMLKRSWMTTIKSRYRIDDSTDAGSIVGFIQGKQPYQVSILNSGGVKRTRVVYFDQRGEPMPSEYGIPGGGFIIFNAPEGLQQILVKPVGTDKIFSTMTLIDANVTNVISHRLR